MTQFSNGKYNLEERTAEFGEEVIDFCKTITQDTISKPIISQLIRSATSIGANYCEANCASSKKDFANKIFISKKESKETEYWLRILSKADESTKDKCYSLLTEAHELTLIFSKIAVSCN